VLREACRQIRQWSEAGLAPLQTAVNVSAVQLNRGHLVDSVKRALQESGIEPGQLELEITESFVIADRDQSFRSLSQLKEMGVRISIDDFGTGYSSMSFVRDMTSNRGNASIVKAIIALGHSLGLEVVAEGVEEAEQASYLRSLQCDAIQGYLISRPMPAEDMAGFLASYRPQEKNSR